MTDERSRGVEWLAVAGIVAFSLFADGLGPDDTLHFNYVNNVADASPIVLTQGYLHVLPGLAIAALAPLAFVVQAVGYRVIALSAVLVLLRELRQLFRLTGSDREAIVLACAVVLALTSLDPSLLGYVTWINWTACLAAITCLFRADARNTPLTGLGFISVGAALMTTPVGLLVAPICAFLARSAGGRRRPDAAAGPAMRGSVRSACGSRRR